MPLPRFGLAFLLGCLALGAANAPISAEEPAPATPAKPVSAAELFRHDRLIAWCIVPFDAKRRGPAERAEMLQRLGFKHFAYDYRAEHLPTFDREATALKERGIGLDAWWFPGELNAEAKRILAVCQRHDVHPQLWVTGGGGPTASPDDQRRRVVAEAARLRPIVDAAAAAGCQVGLYNHGGWFGEPENQLAVIEELQAPNVGVVYNLHHAHEQIDRFADVLAKIKPRLLALNLNGMTRDGERRGQKILPLGQGDLDLDLLKTIQASGFSGPFGILGHTMDDAEARLQDNLDGLDWLVRQLDGQPAGARPTPRTMKAEAAATGAESGGALTDSARGLAEAAPPREFDAAFAAAVLADAQQHGVALDGAEVFSSTKLACAACHRVGETGGAVGPALSDVGRRMAPAEIVESVLWPKRLVKPEYTAWILLLDDGRTVQGYKRSETADKLEFFEPATGRALTLDPRAIEDQRQVGTLMPDGLAAAMTPTERRDVLRFLLDLGHAPGLEKAVRPNVPVEFAYDRAPLDRDAWPLWDHPVNRDRVYDFYAKEALFFRSVKPRPHLLPAFPGLDGGKLGHWGNQNEKTWGDPRWNDVDLGSLLSGVLHAPGYAVPKAVGVRLGDHGELATCFNPETLAYDALWRGGFFKFTDVRHGFMDGLRPDGEMLPRPEAGRPADTGAAHERVYHGFYRYGRRVVFSYRLDGVELLDSPWVEDGKFTRVVAPADTHPLKAALAGGPAQWPQELPGSGKLGAGRPYSVDVIEPPAENPWKSLFFFGDHDFLPDGSALLSTMQGDVWHVTGLDAELKHVRWRRFASGLHQPLGLVVAEGQVYVLGRDQITRLHDLNRDGEADFYECFSNKQFTSVGGHDFICGLARDREGRFYAASSKQGLIRISADGQQVDVLATGFRNPDGVGLYPDGAVTVPCSEGDWTPASMLCLVKPTGASGAPPHFGAGGPRDGKPPSPPFVYLARGLDNSSGGQVAVPDDRWGPLAGTMVHLSFGAGSHMLILRDEVDGVPQGAVTPLAGEFRSGAHRGKFNPLDGQLYVSGMAGWGTYTPDDGCFERVRYGGDAVQWPRAVHVHENGVLVSFTAPLDAKKLAALENHFAQTWNYRYSPGYGSPEFSTTHRGVVGHDGLRIAGVHPIDSTSCFVELPGLQPVNQLHLLLDVDDDRPRELFITVNRLDKPFTGFPGYKPVKKTIAAHPLAVDVALLGKTQPNPWRAKLPGATSLDIAAGQNLTFSTRQLRVKAGATVKLTFTNPDVVPHNWVLAKPDALARVGELANRLVADPEAFTRHYVPKTDDVLCYTDIVAPQERFTIYFKAPAAPGRYPYLCSFPGHWMVMNGELIVE